MDKTPPEIELVDRAIFALLCEGLDVRDPEIAAGFVQAVTTRLSGPGSKRPFPVILEESVKAVKAAQEKRSEMDELEELINAYNASEQIQQERLEAIYRIFRDRRGYREIKFANGDKWGPNDFQAAPEAVIMPRAVGKYFTFIVSFQAGAPGNGSTVEAEEAARKFVLTPHLDPDLSRYNR